GITSCSTAATVSDRPQGGTAPRGRAVPAVVSVRPNSLDGAPPSRHLQRHGALVFAERVPLVTVVRRAGGAVVVDRLRVGALPPAGRRVGRRGPGRGRAGRRAVGPRRRRTANGPGLRLSTAVAGRC